MRLIGWSLFLGVAGLFIWFALNNWTPVPVNLSATAFVEPALPVLVLLALLTGFVPTWVMHKLSRFLLNRRLAKAEKRIALLQAEMAGSGRALPAESAEAAILARSQAAGRAGGYDELPPQASPMAVPPAG